LGSLSVFHYWLAVNLGVGWAMKDPPVRSFVAQEKKVPFEGAFEVGQPSLAAVAQSALK